MIVLKVRSQIIDSVTFSPDSRGIVARGREAIFCWPDLSESLKPTVFDCGLSREVDFVAGGQFIAAATSRNGLWIYPIHGGEGHLLDDSKDFSDILCSPVEPIVVAKETDTRDNSGGLYCFRINENGTWTKLWEHDRKHIYPIMLSVDHKSVLESLPVHPVDQGWLQHDILTGETIATARKHSGHTGIHDKVSSDHTLWACGIGRQIWYRVTSLERNSEQFILNDSKKDITEVAFHPSGRYLAASCNDGTVMFYNTSTWTLVQKFSWDVGRLRCVAFSPDGTLAAVGSHKGRIVVWDLDI